MLLDPDTRARYNARLASAEHWAYQRELAKLAGNAHRMKTCLDQQRIHERLATKAIARA